MILSYSIRLRTLIIVPAGIMSLVATEPEGDGRALRWLLRQVGQDWRDNDHLTPGGRAGRIGRSPGQIDSMATSPHPTRRPLS